MIDKPEYIERGAALAQSITVKHYDGVLGGVCDHEYVRTKDINAIPAAAVEPVVHARWEQEDWFDEDNGVYTCSACKEPYTLISGTPEDNQYNFCPNCGAHVDLKEERK